MQSFEAMRIGDTWVADAKMLRFRRRRYNEMRRFTADVSKFELEAWESAY